jgi:hypothetical protein
LNSTVGEILSAHKEGCLIAISRTNVQSGYAIVREIAITGGETDRGQLCDHN